MLEVSFCHFLSLVQEFFKTILYFPHPLPPGNHHYILGFYELDYLYTSYK